MLYNFRFIAILLFIKSKYQLYLNNIFIILYTYIIFISSILIISSFFSIFNKYFSYEYNVLHSNYIDMAYIILYNL